MECSPREREQGRSIAPLKPAADARVLDTSDMSVEEMLSRMEGIVRGESPA